jgi:hypothetical protein
MIQIFSKELMSPLVNIAYANGMLVIRVWDTKAENIIVEKNSELAIERAKIQQNEFMTKNEPMIMIVVDPREAFPKLNIGIKEALSWMPPQAVKKFLKDQVAEIHRWIKEGLDKKMGEL